MPLDKNIIRCTGCKKVLCNLEYLNDGKLEIKCKCGVINTIEALPKQTSEIQVNGQPGLNLGTFSIQHISTASERPDRQ